MKRPAAYRAGGLLLVAIGGLAACLGSLARRGNAESVDGMVTERGGAAAAGALVRIKGTATQTITDACGRFRLPARRGRVTAWKAGHFIAGTRLAGTELALSLRPLPDSDNSGYSWVDPAPGGPANCGTCHAEIYREWEASAHARSTTGSRFRDLYEGTDAAGRAGVGWGLKTESPDAAGVCTACHAPAVGERDAARFDLGALRGVAARGVHCDFCHKVSGTGDGAPGLTHGSFDLRLLRPAAGQIFFGPLDDVDRGEDAYSPVYHDSRYCASCHEGIVLGVHVYGTYSEWLASPARRDGKQCQDCHMSPSGTLANMAPGHGGIERDPSTLASHGLFPGGQAAMLSRALRVRTSVRRASGSSRVTVNVRAEGVGHRVPTGFIDRHLVLAVEAFDVNGRSMHAATGPTLPAAAGPALAGRPGRLFARFRQDFEGRSPVPFWRVGNEGADTRLVPDTPDVSDYAFSGDLARLRVRLSYRRFWQEVASTKGWADNDLLVYERELRFTPSGANGP